MRKKHKNDKINAKERVALYFFGGELANVTSQLRQGGREKKGCIKQ